MNRAYLLLPRLCVRPSSLHLARAFRRGTARPTRTSRQPTPPHSQLRCLATPSSSTPLQRRGLLTLAIESSCDDTCVAILEKTPSGAAYLHFNKKITSDQSEYRGVHPAVALESHAANLGPLLQEALRSLPEANGATTSAAAKGQEGRRAAEGEKRERRDDAVLWVDGQPRRRPDFVTVTRGPGMRSNLATGLNTAKGLAIAWGVPLLGVNHMEAHALTPRLVSALEKGQRRSSTHLDYQSPSSGNKVVRDAGEDRSSDMTPPFPFLSLLVSGGHTLLVRSNALNDHVILAETANIAIGDMLDKCARVILPPGWIERAHGGGSVMYGPLLEEFAFPHSTAADRTTETTTKKTIDDGGKEEESEYDYGYSPTTSEKDRNRLFDSGYGWTLTPPLAGKGERAHRRDMTLDFSGASGQIRRLALERPDMPVEERRVLARATMRFAFEYLVARLLTVLDDEEATTTEETLSASAAASGSSAATGKEYRSPNQNQNQNLEDGQTKQAGKIKTIVVAGGVASNRYLMHILHANLAVRSSRRHLEVLSPPPALCTDNAAMIAWTGLEMYEAGWRSRMDILALRRWPLDARTKSTKKRRNNNTVSSTDDEDVDVDVDEGADSGAAGVPGVPGWYNVK